MPTTAPGPLLELTHWRREVGTLYAAVRAAADPEAGHRLWVEGRDRLFREHPQSPLPAGDPLRETGLPQWPYQRELRWELKVQAARREEVRTTHSAGDGEIRMSLVGHVVLPEPIGAGLDLWWLEQYGGGLFLPLRDGTAGRTSYGGGRYLLDTAKGADLGGRPGHLVVDLNFAYHPSCRYDDAWECPLAAPGNTVTAMVEAGERL